MSIPTKIISGDTHTFTVSNSDYPSSGSWTAKAILVGDQGASSAITAIENSNGEDYDFTISAAVSAALNIGFYTLSIWVENAAATIRHTINESVVEVTPNLATQTSALDTRTHAQRMVTILETTQRDIANGAITARSVGNVTYSRQNIGELTKELIFWRNQTFLEKQAQRVAQGQKADKYHVRITG